MPTFEPIIRPFETGDTTPKAGVATVPAVVPNVLLIIGAGGSGKIMHGSYQSTTQFYTKKYPKEKQQT